METKNLGHTIKNLRKQRGWTQIDLAEKLGCTQGIITAYENGLKKPSVDKIASLAKVLGVTTDELIGQTEIKTASVSKNPKLWRKFEQVQKLPQQDKRMVFKMIDGLIAQQH
jgi:transcriptional regulator with XRE-family HTH domain